MLKIRHLNPSDSRTVQTICLASPFLWRTRAVSQTTHSSSAVHRLPVEEAFSIDNLPDGRSEIHYSHLHKFFQR